ncbi:MAG: ribokinase [Actinomycetota bacterium]|nr:ribokinase [Actinomycetota bacterium]
MSQETSSTGQVDVVVVGSFVVGIVVRTAHLPQPGETLIGDRYDVGPGGKGANAAIAAVRSGATVAFVGRVGDDDHAGMAEGTFRREGVVTDFLQRTRDVPTGVGLVHLDTHQENSIAVYPGANDALTGADVDAARAGLSSNPRVIVCQHEVPQDVVAHSVQWGRSIGATVVLNPAPFRPVPLETLQGIEVLVPNEGEAHELLGALHGNLYVAADPAQLAADLQAVTGRWVVITMGRSGCMTAGPDGYLQQMPTHRVDAIDTTGAGDTFTGALAAAIARGANVPQACEWALAAAALSTTGLGSVRAIPTSEKIQELIDQNPQL